MRASDVFTPNKLPTVTYIGDHLVDKARQLTQALESGAAVIALSGPSKSGKTVFIEKTIGRENLLQVTGAGIDSPQTLWNRVFDLIGTPIKVTTKEGSGFTGTLAAKGSVGVPAIVQGEATASGAWQQSKDSAAERAVYHLQLLIKELGGSPFIVFIDDFHYIGKDVQQAVAQQIKEAVRGGVRFVCAAVPYHSDDVLLANADLRGRALKLDFNYWNLDELKEIARRGFDALNVEPSRAMVEAFAQEAAGSPQLMQSLCLNTCFETGTAERLANRAALGADSLLIGRVCVRTAATADYSSTVNKMKEGPKTRGMTRNAYVVADTLEVLDVYPIILRALALNPPELNIRYANLLGRLASVCEAEHPSGSSVTGACAHMFDIANGAEARTVVEWDGGNDVLDIRDPYLLYFLRWGDWK